MQHKSMGPFLFQVCVCMCDGVEVPGARTKVMSALSIGSPIFSFFHEFPKRWKRDLNSSSCTPKLLHEVIASCFICLFLFRFRFLL